MLGILFTILFIEKMENPLISIIVPMYNGENTIIHCLCSLHNQSYKNIEVIVVNDGSTDKSLEQCQNYLKKHPDFNMSVYTKDNGGLSSARNFGIDKSSSQTEYICFVDCDDYINSNYVKLMYEAIKLGHSQLSMCLLKDVTKFDYRLTASKEASYSVEQYFNVNSNKEFIALYKSGILNSSCNKLYRKKILLESDLHFENIPICEDLYFNFEYLKLCKIVTFVKQALYYYHHHAVSLTTKVSPQMIDSYLRIQLEFKAYYGADYWQELAYFFYLQYQALFLRLVRKREFKTCKHYLREKEIEDVIKRYKSNIIYERLIKICLKYKMMRSLYLLQKLV